MNKLFQNFRTWMHANPKRAILLIFAAGFLLNSILFAGAVRADHNDIKVGDPIRLWQACQSEAADELITIWRTPMGDIDGRLSEFMGTNQCRVFGAGEGLGVEALEVSGPIQLGNGDYVWRVVVGIETDGTKWVTIVKMGAPHSA